MSIFDGCSSRRSKTAIAGLSTICLGRGPCKRRQKCRPPISARSPTPPAEAIRELVQEGILTSIPYAGTFVIDVTAGDIEDAYSLNKVLDEFAIERTWPNRDERFFAELDRRHAAVKWATR